MNQKSLYKINTEFIIKYGFCSTEKEKNTRDNIIKFIKEVYELGRQQGIVDYAKEYEKQNVR